MALYTFAMMFPLITKRLRIEPLSQGDVVAFVAYRKVPEVARFQSWSSNYSIAQGYELVRSQTGIVHPDKGEWLQIGIKLRSTGELVGDVAINNTDPSEPAVTLGFTIAQQHQGLGYAKEAVGTVISELRQEFSNVRFWAFTDARNAPSIALLKSLGFQELPEQKYLEEFKGETVEVLRFEL